ncbi:MAG: 6-bladed beta-propeller [Tannerella sp.]|jgi:hypothetical protein|nr:6-bladed beta-propeller [Tannerella sp.]
MKKKIFLYVCLFLVYSCKEYTARPVDKNTEIELDTTEFSQQADVPGEIETIPIFSNCTNYNNNLSAIAADISFIQMDFDLPFNDNQIYNIALSENNIFLSELYQVMLYDRNGKFLRKIGSRGPGPKEYVQITALQIDPASKLIYIQDVTKKALVFRFDGTFVKNIPIKAGIIAFIDSSMIALSSRLEDRRMKPAPLIKFINRDGGDIQTHWSKNYPIPRQPRELMSNQNFLWNGNNDYYYLEFGADTIFRIAGDTLIPSRVLTGNLKLSLTENNSGVESGNKLRLYSLLFFAHSGIFESNRFMICRLYDDYEYFITVYDKKEKRFHRTHYENAAEDQFDHRKLMGYFYDDMVSGLDFNPKFQSMGKALGLIPAVEICEKRQEILDFIEKHPNESSKQFKKIVQEITEDDNAVLMIVTFK